MTLTIHYCTACFKLEKFTLCATPFEKRHTGEAIAELIKKILTDEEDGFGLELSKCSMIVRDGGSNIAKASEILRQKNFVCFAHAMHSTVGGFLVEPKKMKPKRNTKTGEASASTAEASVDGGDDVEVTDSPETQCMKRV